MACTLVVVASPPQSHSGTTASFTCPYHLPIANVPNWVPENDLYITVASPAMIDDVNVDS